MVIKILSVTNTYIQYRILNLLLHTFYSALNYIMLCNGITISALFVDPLKLSIKLYNATLFDSFLLTLEQHTPPNIIYLLFKRKTSL